MVHTDLAIIGAGIAGASAGIYAQRAGLKFMLFEKGMLGGQLMYVGTVDNYPGLQSGLGGEDIFKNLSMTLKELEVGLTNTEIHSVKVINRDIHLSSNESAEFCAKALIVATGASMRKLGVPGEPQFTGKGVSYCAVCDGFFFKDREVAVVGGGNSAVEEAMYLSGVCKRVYLIHRRKHLRALEYLQQKLIERKNVKILWNTVVREIKGDGFLEQLIMEDVLTQQVKTLSVEGLFIAVGIEPNTPFVRNEVSCDEKGFILTDEEMRTSSECIFACGDCRRRPLRQLITAASEGAIAAISAYRYLKGNYISS